MTVIASKLYNDLIDITEDYLGPAAKRFIDRQIQNHLEKEPGELSKAELNKLIDWCALALGLLTDDNRIKLDYIDRLKKLSKASGR